MELSSKSAHSLSAPTHQLTRRVSYGQLSQLQKIRLPVELVLVLVSQPVEGPDVAGCRCHVVVTHVDCFFYIVHSG